MAFEPFDLGKVLMTAQTIKGMRQDAENDKLRQAYLSTQIAGAQQTQKMQMDQQTAKMHFLQNQAIESAPDPIAATRQLAPDVIAQYEQAHGADSFGQLTADQVRQIAGYAKQQAAAQAGVNLQPDANAKFTAEARLAADTQNFGQQVQLAGIQNQYGLDQIAARGAEDRRTAEISVPAKAAKSTQQLRKEFRGLQSVKDYETVLPLIQSAKTAPDTPQGDLQLIYTVGKILDPGSVVREGELELTSSAAPFLQQVIGRARKETGKGRLTPQTRADMISMLQQRVQGYEQAYTRDFDQYSQYAREGQVDPASVVGSRPESAFGKQPSAITADFIYVPGKGLQPSQ